MRELWFAANQHAPYLERCSPSEVRLCCRYQAKPSGPTSYKSVFSYLQRLGRMGSSSKVSEKLPLPILKCPPEFYFPRLLQREVLELFIWIACSRFPFPTSLNFECVLGRNKSPSGSKTSLSRYAMYPPHPREPPNCTGSGKPHLCVL